MKPPTLFRAMVSSVFAILLIGVVSGLIGATTPASITYQGRLLDNGGTPLQGNFSMRFQVYNDAVGGSILFDSGDFQVPVNDGLFEVEIPMNVDGSEIWLQMRVEGEFLSPRQPLRAAPYALGLRPGARMQGPPRNSSGGVLEVQMTGNFPSARGVSSVAPATGTALYGQAAGGTGLYASSTNTYGVWGASQNSWGGYFTSQNGHGIRVDTSGADHYDHGALITSNMGFAVYAQSSANQALRGEAGDISGFALPLGQVGVAGIGANRGAYGSSGAGSGVYGTSNSNYGVWGQSSTYRGITGRTDRPDNNYGLYTPDNIYSLNLNRAGSTSQVMQNGGSEPLEPGDVVVFSGIGQPLERGGAPMVRVAKAGTVDSNAIAGVVETRFNVATTLESFDEAYDAALLEAQERGDQTRLQTLAREAQPTLPGAVPVGEYLLVVVHGPARVKASAVSQGAIRIGDTLVVDSLPGMVARESSERNADFSGETLGQALQSLEAGDSSIYVYVQ